MRTFADLEREYARTVVSLSGGGATGHGILSLNGKDTSAVITSADYLAHPDDENGWFKLCLRTNSGIPVLLHNALSTSSGSISHDGEHAWEEHIYPNAVALQSDALTKDGRVKSVTFTAQRLNVFFHYETIESQFLWNTPPTAIAGLKALRRHRRAGYDFFNPETIYIVHKPRRAIRISVHGRRYSVSTGMSSARNGFGKLALDTEPIAEIVFDEPIDIDGAIAAVWNWKRFFSLLGMNPMPLTALTFAASTKARAKRSSVYLPPHASWARANDGMFDLHPSSVPFNLWKHRRTLSKLMEAWLEAEPQRALFRGAVGNVIEEFGARISPNDVLTLCAGIETLTELDAKSPISKKELGFITAAAMKAVDDRGIEVGEDRVRGTLAQLRRQSLAQRLRHIFDRLEEVLPPTDAKRLEAAIIQIRNMAAHGQGYSDAVMPTVESTVCALLSVCTLFDLVTCGMPARSGMHARRLEWAIAGLRQFDKRAGKA